MVNVSPHYRDFVQALRALTTAAQLPPLIVASGPSVFLVTKTASALADITRQRHGVSSVMIDATELDRQGWQSMWRQRSLFDPVALWIVRRGERKKELLAELLAASDDPPGRGITIIIQFESDEPPVKLTREWTRLQAAVVPCVEPPPDELPGFTLALARKHQLALSADCAPLLLERTGGDLFHLENEIIRLSLLFHGKEGAISGAELAPQLGLMREESALKLADLAASGKIEHALGFAAVLAARGEEALPTLGVLSRHCRMALGVPLRQKSGQSVWDIARNLHAPKHVIERYLRAGSPQSAIRGLLAAQEADMALKSTPLADDLVVADVIMQTRSTGRGK